MIHEMDLYLPIPEPSEDFDFNVYSNYIVEEEISPFTWTFEIPEEIK